MLKRISLLFIIAAVAIGIAAAPASATATGVCNTWNADVTGDEDLALYLWGEWGNAKYDDGHYIGFSYGLFEMFEIGGSYRLTEDDDYRQDPTFDAKFRFDLGGPREHEPCEGAEEGECCGGPCVDDIDTTGIAIGVDNINFDEDQMGNFVPYIVYTHDFDGMRGHVGYAFEEDNGAIFAGFDAVTGDVTFKWDWTQIDDGEDWMAAVGFDLPFQWYGDNWNLCSFLSFSSNDNYADVWTVEFSYVFD